MTKDTLVMYLKEIRAIAAAPMLAVDVRDRLIQIVQLCDSALREPTFERRRQRIELK